MFLAASVAALYILGTAVAYMLALPKILSTFKYTTARRASRSACSCTHSVELKCTLSRLRQAMFLLSMSGAERRLAPDTRQAPDSVPRLRHLSATTFM
uniref:Secreted protein n=1 Tax=Plectus sambesii TaxID=2011161 RepID=A0A914WIC0_9BILA